jgi:hypothetical protein
MNKNLVFVDQMLVVVIKRSKAYFFKRQKEFCSKIQVGITQVPTDQEKNFFIKKVIAAGLHSASLDGDRIIE